LWARPGAETNVGEIEVRKPASIVCTGLLIGAPAFAAENAQDKIEKLQSEVDGVKNVGITSSSSIDGKHCAVDLVIDAETFGNLSVEAKGRFAAIRPWQTRNQLS
jgi:hypothetical protein